MMTIAHLYFYSFIFVNFIVFYHKIVFFALVSCVPCDDGDDLERNFVSFFFYQIPNI